MLEILLLSAVAVCGWQAQLLFRKGGPRRRTYAIMLGACALVSLAAWAGLSDPGAAELSRVVGAAAVGAFVFLVFVPVVLRGLVRRQVQRDKVAPALRLLGLIELLQPGMGAREEREMLAAYAELREGRPGRAIDSLKAARAAAAEPLVRRQIDERIVMAYLTARAFGEAVAHFERTIEAQPGPLGAALLVEVLRAYGEIGALDKAADLMRRIEDSPLAREPALAPLVARARLVFLAFAGREAAVARLVAPGGSMAHMPAAARAYWLGIARRQAGDAVGAREALAAAVKSSGRDRRAGRVAAEALERLERGPAPEAVRLEGEAAGFADKVAERAVLAPPAVGAGAAGDPAQAPLPRLEDVPWGQVPVTTALIAANLAVALLVATLMGSSLDPAVMIDAGANLGAATLGGEPWRLVSSIFLHIGVLHLLLNMYGLWVLGRLVEQILGSRRMFIVYLLAGIGGSLASALHGRVGVSAGASGAVFGLLGAAIAEFAIRRSVYPERWRKALLGNLLFLAAANLVIGQAVPMIDQAAHVGGMVVGGVSAAALAPRGRFGRGAGARVLAQVLAVAGAVVIVASAALTLTNRIDRTVERLGWIEVADRGVLLQVPRLGNTLAGSGVMAEGVALTPETRASSADIFAQVATESRDSAAVRSVERSKPLWSIEGWEHMEWLLQYRAPMGAAVPMRVGTFVRHDAEATLVVTVTVPARQAPHLAGVVRRIVESAQRIDAPAAD